jgi:NTP pyrophosphatase (non-canonical NTP hydrolase)
LQRAARGIARNFDKPIASPLYALSKLVIAPRWIDYGVRAPGLRRWKRGELLEVAQAAVQRDWAAAREEWGDVGYYVAQSWRWLWWLYAAITPEQIIINAVRKFEARAAQKKRRV